MTRDDLSSITADDESWSFSFSSRTTPSSPRALHHSYNGSYNGNSNPNHHHEQPSAAFTLQPSKELEQERRVTTILAASRLRFDKLGLVARDEETKILGECLDRLISTTPPTTPETPKQRELVIFKGEPGAGKSALAMSLQNHAVFRNKNTGIFAMGKYDMTKGDLPYAAIASVMDEICQGLCNDKDKDKNDSNATSALVNTIRSKLEDIQVVALQTMVRSFAKLLALDNHNSGDHDAVATTTTTTSASHPVMNRETLDQSFKTFFRAVSSHRPPLVLLLDDLQWADSESLHTIKVLLNDPENDHLMVLGCYRSNEVDGDETHILSKVLQDLRDGTGTGSLYQMTEILLDKFNIADTNKLIQDLLSMDDDAKDTLELAKLCHKRTSGNVYFLREFLSMLKEEKLLTFDLGASRWKWDLEAMEEQTVVTTNILQLIEARIKKMRPSLVEMLNIAACLGSRFDRRVLQRVWAEFNTCNDGGKEETIESLLDAAAEEAILEAQSIFYCRFAHDKIQESIIKLMSVENFKSLQAKVGNFLHETLKEEEAEDMLFVVVDLLNASDESTPHISALNVRAARKAQSLAAFSSASTYIDHGYRKLPTPPAPSTVSPWDAEDYALPLELFSIGAEVELCLGNVEKAVFYSRQIIDQKHITPLDKVRAYKVMAKKLYMARCPDESLQVCLDILAQLGYKFPRVKLAQQVQASLALDTTRRKLKQMNSFNKRTFINDPKLLETIPLLEQAASTALQAKKKELYLLLRCYCVQLIIENGLTNEAASCFASFANIMMHEKDDWETGLYLANLALDIQDRLGSRYTETSTLFKTNQLVLGWALPLKSRLKSIVKGFRSGMLSGNIEGGCWCLMLAIWCQFYDGTPLRCVEEDCETYVVKMESLRQKNQANLSKWSWQLILNLIGHPKNPNTSVISGTAIAEDEATSMADELHLYAAKSFACAHFGDYATGAEMALRIGESHYERLSGMAFFGFERFGRGLCLYAHARNTKQNKYKKAAKVVRSKLFHWVSKGAVNLKHHLDILDAEDAATGKDIQKTKSLYEKAITGSARGGFLADAGLANERYASFLMETGEAGEARYRLEEAIKYYSEWGAMKKVDLLRAAWAHVL